jgi:hypothetical protein
VGEREEGWGVVWMDSERELAAKIQTKQIHYTTAKPMGGCALCLEAQLWIGKEGKQISGLLNEHEKFKLPA